MVLPAPVVLVKALGWAQGLAFVVLSNRRAANLRSAAVTDSAIGPPEVLLAYRLSMLCWALFIGLRQLARRGPYAFVFFTVWNWWLLTLFFLCGSAASLRAWARKRRGRSIRGSSSGDGAAELAAQPGTSQQQQHLQRRMRHKQQLAGGDDLPADWLDRAVIAVFSTELPMTLAIDFLTWAVLVPMILAEYAPPRLQFWEANLFCFESYNQHGFNAVMMLGELVLNRVPVTLYESGWLALWSSLFGVWSAAFYHRTGRAIYPFLDVSKPYAWAAYLGIFATLWVAYLLFMALAWLKEWALPAPGTKSGPSVAGAPASPGMLAATHGGMHARMQDLVDAHVPLLGGDKLKMG